MTRRMGEAQRRPVGAPAALPLALLLAACLGAGCGWGPRTAAELDGPAAPAGEVGKPAPDFVLEDLSGAKVSLGDFFQPAVVYAVRDGRLVHQPRPARPVLLMLGPTSCPYSRDELAEVDRLARSLTGRGMVFLAVVQGPRKDAAEWARGRGPDLRVLADGDGRVRELYAVRKTPDVLLIRNDGTVAYRSGGGFVPARELRPLAEAVLAGKALDGMPLPKPGAG